MGTCQTSLLIKKIDKIIDKYDDKVLMVTFEDDIVLEFDIGWYKRFCSFKRCSF